MLRRSNAGLHAQHCRCAACAPGKAANRRSISSARAAGRALLLVAALFAIPFIIAHALASVKGEHR